MSNRKWKLTTVIHPTTYRGGGFLAKKKLKILINTAFSKQILGSLMIAMNIILKSSQMKI